MYLGTYFQRQDKYSERWHKQDPKATKDSQHLCKSLTYGVFPHSTLLSSVLSHHLGWVNNLLASASGDVDSTLDFEDVEPRKLQFLELSGMVSISQRGRISSNFPCTGRTSRTTNIAKEVVWYGVMAGLRGHTAFTQWPFSPSELFEVFYSSVIHLGASRPSSSERQNLF